MTTFYLKTFGDTVNTVSLENTDLADHMVGLFSIHGELVTHPDDVAVYLCCDICENSIIAGGRRLPVLRQIRRGPNPHIANDFSKVIWIDTTGGKNVTSIRLYLVNDEGRLVTVSRCNLSCTLLVFKKKRGEDGERH